VAEHEAALKEARARSSQALAQALVCAALVPLFGGMLYLLLPGVTERRWAWCAGCVAALGLAAAGALWMLGMAEAARWGGIHRSRRGWVLGAQCAGERFLAFVRAGTPADLAWEQACALLPPGLAARWGHSVWQGAPAGERLEPAAAVVAGAGDALRKAVQLSLMEGRPCTERAETALAALRKDVATQIERELAMLGTRALKPLFACVAPALFGLLVFGLFLSWEQAGGAL
jgi:hypothetical protein